MMLMEVATRRWHLLLASVLMDDAALLACTTSHDAQHHTTCATAIAHAQPPPRPGACGRRMQRARVWGGKGGRVLRRRLGGAGRCEH